MTSLSVEQAKAKLRQLVAQAEDSNEPVKIVGKSASAVLVAESVWRGMEDTLYLLSIPGMRESLRQGMAQPLSECSDKLPW